MNKEKRGNVNIYARIKPIQEGDQNIFSGDDENGNSVVVTQQPQKQRYVSSQYKNDKDLDKINEIISDRVDIFMFDSVFSQKSSQETFYHKTVKDAVSRVINGQNTSILIYGPSRCGKTYAFTGSEKNQKGLMFRCVDELLSKIDAANDKNASFQLQLSIYAVYNNEIFDLLTHENQDEFEIIEHNQNDVKITGLTKHQIKYKGDYKNKYVNALKKVSSLCQLLNEKKLYEKSHIVIQFNVQETELINYKLNLVRLADIDLIDKQINGDDFEIIEQYITQINQNQNHMSRSYKKSKLIASIKDTLNENTQSYFICCVSSMINQYNQSLLSLNYSQRLCSQSGNQNEKVDGKNYSSNQSVSNSQKRTIPQRPPITPNSVRHSHNDGILKPSNSQQNFRPASAVNSNNNQSKQNTGNQNNHIEFIVNEVENIYNDIRKQSRALSKLPERERNEWISQKEYTLSDLQKQLESQPYTRDIPYCETLLTKCHRQLRLLNPNIGEQRQVSGSPSRGAPGKTNILSQQNNSFSRQNHSRQQSESFKNTSNFTEQQGRMSPSQERRQNSYEYLREKEEKLDKDFMRLIDRYNHSKELIDNLGNPTSQLHQQNQINNNYQSTNRVKTLPSIDQRSPIQNLNRNSQNILSPYQQKTIDINSIPVQKFLNDEYHSQNTSGFIEQPAVARSRIASLKAGEVSPKFDVNIAEENDKNVGQSLKRLKETIEIKENIEKSKNQKLRQLNKDLKNSLREYVDKYEDITDLIQNKDQEIQKLEYELRQVHEDVLLNVDSIKQFKIKEQSWMLIEVELRESNMQLKSKLQKKKKKINEFKEESRKKAEEIANQQRQHENDIQKYHRTVQELQEYKLADVNKAQSLNETVMQLRKEMELREQEQRKVIQNLQEQREQNQELNQKYQNEFKQKNEIQAQNKELTRKREELEEQIQILEQKLSKHKQKFEEERSKINEEKNYDTNKQKEKITQLKAQLTDTEDRQQEFEAKYQIILKQSDSLELQLRETTKYINEQKDINEELTFKIIKLTEERNNSQLESEKLQILISTQEKKIEKFDLSQHGDTKIINELKENLQRVQEQLKRREDDLSTANENIKSMKEQQNIELSNLEVKLDQIYQDFNDCKQENVECKKQETDNKITLQSLEEQVEKYKEKYLKSKHSNKNLQLHLKELEDKVKGYMTERSNEIQTQALERERKSKVEHTQKSKLRILDEIQSMIKNHKQNTTHNKKYQ